MGRRQFLGGARQSPLGDVEPDRDDQPAVHADVGGAYTQPLLRDFRIDATRQQLLVTRINQDISDIQLRQTTMNTVANVRNAYWDYVFAVQSVDVARQSLLLAEELLRNNQTKVEIGTMAPIDVVQAQSQAAQQRQVVVTAEGTRRTAEIALKRLIVSGTADPLWTSTIEPVDRPDFRPEPIDRTAATQRALSTRTDVLQARKTLEANDVTLRLLNNQKLPQVDLQTRYATTGIGGTRLITQGTRRRPRRNYRRRSRRLSGRAGHAVPQQLPTWSVALNISYNLGTSAADASIARARIQQSQIEVQLRQIDLQVTSDVSNAAIQVENAAERVQAAQASRDLTQQQLDAENSKFGVGMSTNYQVVLAQRDLSNAQNIELQAVLAYRKAVVDFERVQQTGTAGNVTSFRDENGRRHGRGRATRRAVARLGRSLAEARCISASGGGGDEPVTLDVVVTDAKSRPVKDLKPGDLELTDAGETRPWSTPCACRPAAGASSASFSTNFTYGRATRRSARVPR